MTASEKPLKNRNRWIGITRLLKLIGIVIFGWIAWHLDWPDFIRHLQNTEMLWIIAWTIPTFACAWLRALRWKIILASSGHHIGITQLYHYTIEGALLGTVTPGRLGELGKAAFLVPHEIPIKSAIKSVILDRAVDLWALAILTSIALVTLNHIHPFFLPLGIAIGIAVAIATLFLRHQAVQKRVLALLGMSTSDSSHGIFAKETAKILAITAANCLMIMGTSYATARAAGIDIAPTIICLLCNIASVIAFIPISISGIGTRDAFYITTLGTAGVPSSQALFFSLLDGIVLALSGLFIQYLVIKSISILRRQ